MCLKLDQNCVLPRKNVSVYSNIRVEWMFRIPLHQCFAMRFSRGSLAMGLGCCNSSAFAGVDKEGKYPERRKGIFVHVSVLFNIFLSPTLFFSILAYGQTDKLQLMVLSRLCWNTLIQSLFLFRFFSGKMSEFIYICATLTLWGKIIMLAKRRHLVLPSPKAAHEPFRGHDPPFEKHGVLNSSCWS